MVRRDPLPPVDAGQAYAFLMGQWSSGDSSQKATTEMGLLQDKTLQAMVTLRQGGFFCLQCKACPFHDGVCLEGHHFYYKMMNASGYRYCQRQKIRRFNMQKLWAELVEAIQILCKTCHESDHHDRPRSVKQGIERAI